MSGDGSRDAIRVAVLARHRLAGDALGAALRASGLSVDVVTTHWPDLLASDEMPVDVALVDLDVHDGVLASTRVQDLDDLGVRSVILGAHVGTTAAAAAIRAGAFGFVATSDPLDDLEKALRAAAAGTRQIEEPAHAASIDPGLGRQEQRALVLYAGGRSIREVARDMRTTEETVKSYIKRGRRKYRQVGVDVGTRVLLRAHAAREGWLSHA
jgi:DNA-binding NarL/FixJ family response regulator